VARVVLTVVGLAVSHGAAVAVAAWLGYRAGQRRQATK
jgi:hypothetical protein